MSDNVQPIFEPEQQPEQEKPSRMRRWLIFLGILLLVLALLVLFLLSSTTALDGIKRFFRYLGKDETQFGSIEFAPYGTCSYAPVDGQLAVATQSGATLFAVDGSSLGQVQESFSSPALIASDDRLLIYDIGGTYFSVMNSGGVLLFEKTAAGAIYDASLAENGGCAVLYAGSDSRAVLEVYDKSGVLLYRRNSKSHYLNTCALSPDGKLAAVTTLGQEAIAFRSAVQIFRTDSEDVAAECVLGPELIYDFAFVSADTLCAVGENKLYFLGTDGTLRGEYAAENGELIGYCLSGDGDVRALYDLYETGSHYRLITLDEDGKVTASFTVEDTPQHLSVCGSYTAVLTESELFIYDSGLKLRSRTENTGYLCAYVRADGTALCIATGKAELYIP